jgi:hypothetical protein
MARPRQCPCCHRPLQSIAQLDDGLLNCEWHGLFHWEPRYRRLRHLTSRQAWNVDITGQIIAPGGLSKSLESRSKGKPVRLPKLP